MVSVGPKAANLARRAAPVSTKAPIRRRACNRERPSHELPYNDHNPAIALDFLNVRPEIRARSNSAPRARGRHNEPQVTDQRRRDRADPRRRLLRLEHYRERRGHPARDPSRPCHRRNRVRHNRDCRLRRRLLLGRPGRLPAREGRDERRLRLFRRHPREPDLRERPHRDHRPRRGGHDHLRSDPGELRQSCSRSSFR